MNDDKLLQLAIVFGGLSLLAVGGTNVIIPEMHHDVVGVQHWMSDADFAAVFAIAQAAPGPSSLIVTLIGYRVAGLPGAAVATLALITLPVLLTYFLTLVWERARDANWHRAVEHGLGPLTVGLVFASGAVIAKTADHTLSAYILTALATAVFVFSKVNPLIVVGACGLVGYLNWV